MPAPRARARAIGKFVQMYNPADYTQWKAEVTEYLRNEVAPLGEGPFEVWVSVYKDPPKTTKLPFPKPDVDNYAKGVLDAVTQGELWPDDWLVGDLHIKKRWSDNHHPESICLTIGVCEL
ncbi:MAG: RusA family crossover junction endodeoxyribonuclease [Chakrabartia sp.]